MFRFIFNAAVLMGIAVSTVAVGQSSVENGEWPVYGGDLGHTKYSPLDQIGADNVNDLEIAWRWDIGEKELAKEVKARYGGNKNTPIYVDGTLYISTPLSRVAALDPGTGAVKWMFDPEAYKLGRPVNAGWQHRGVSYWHDGTRGRIFIGTGTMEIFALDAETGKLVESFGDGGKMDLLEGLHPDTARRYMGHNAPLAIANGVIVVGSAIFDSPTSPNMPAGHVQGIDAKTGERKWVFHTVPQEGEVGVETWEDDSWKYSGNTNVWSMISVDEELGYVYLPVSTPTNDYYGGQRKGDNLFAESIVCLDAATGERVWHFQAVHHGLWDYDFPCAPTLCDLEVDGRTIKAVIAPSKQGFIYVFDRVTGEPVWPIEERAVPQTTVPGEQTSPTQPFPTKPEPYVRQGITEDDLVDFTPEIKAKALEIAKNYTLGPLFTPPTVLGADGLKGVLQAPSAAGGINWGGAGFDPETQMLYFEAAEIYSLAHVSPGNRDRGVTADYLFTGPRAVIGPFGLPLTKPPYGIVIGMDMKTGTIKWKVPHGQGPTNHPKLKDLNLDPIGWTSHGTLSSGGPLVTKTLLFVNQVQISGDFVSPSKELYMRAFDKETGEVVWEYLMDTPPYGTPMTYMHEGRQYIAMGAGGYRYAPEVLAFALPE